MILLTMMPGFVIWGAGGTRGGQIGAKQWRIQLGAGGQCNTLPPNEVSRGAHET